MVEIVTKWHVIGVFSIIFASIFDVISTSFCFMKFGTNSTIYEANQYLAPYISTPAIHLGIKLALILPVIACTLFAQHLETTISERYNYKAHYMAILPYFLITVCLIIASINNLLLYFTESNLNTGQIIFGFTMLISTSIYITIIRPYQIHLKNLIEKSVN